MLISRTFRSWFYVYQADNLKRNRLQVAISDRNNRIPLCNAKRIGSSTERRYGRLRHTLIAVWVVNDSVVLRLIPVLRLGWVSIFTWRVHFALDQSSLLGPIKKCNILSISSPQVVIQPVYHCECVPLPNDDATDSSKQSISMANTHCGNYDFTFSRYEFSVLCAIAATFETCDCCQAIRKLLISSNL